MVLNPVFAGSGRDPSLIGAADTCAGQTGNSRVVTFNKLVGRRVREERAQQQVGHCVPSPVPHVAAHDRCSGKCEIAKRVQHFVANRLVCVAHATGCHDICTVNDNSRMN